MCGIRTGKCHGFTLLELMITVAIVSILIGIAVPSYESYLTKSTIKAAQSDLVALSLVMENRFQKQLVYPTVTAATTSETRCVASSGTTSCASSASGWQPSQSDSFTYRIVTATLTTYTLEAVGTSGKVNGCSITLTQNNVRAITNCNTYNGSWL